MGTHTDIKWREWGEEAFEQAKESGKPILLDLSAVWCHWCHVMDETSYSDDEVIRLINDHVIPVRVDIDRRPDIRERYNFGGYPTTAFLDDRGQVIAGGTYIPPEQLKRTLMQIKSYYENPDRKAGVGRIPPESRVHATGGPLSADIPEEVLGHLLQQYDETYGGFGTAPKFPNPDALDLALYKYKTSGNKHFLRMVEKTLGGMAGGGMYDREEGGFFRYSVTRDWSEPHFEKMLEVNVGLLRNYLNATSILGQTAFRQTALGVLRYLETILRDPAGGFYGSQDADEEYYKMSKAEREKVKAPYVDETFYADLNGQAISAYVRASAVLNDHRYLEAALDSLGLVEERLMKGDGSLIHYWDGGSGIPGLLSDYTYLSRASLDAYEHTGDPRHLHACQAITNRMLSDLRDDDGLLVDRISSEEDIGLLGEPLRPLVDNSHAALTLLRLREVTGREDYGLAAERILRGFSGHYPRYSIFASTYSLAVTTLLKGPLRLALVGHPDEEKTRKMRVSLLRDFEPRRVLQHLEPGTEAMEQAGYPADPVPAVYACVGTRCSPAITASDPLDEVRAFVSDFESG